MFLSFASSSHNFLLVFLSPWIAANQSPVICHMHCIWTNQRTEFALEIFLKALPFVFFFLTKCKLWQQENMNFCLLPKRKMKNICFCRIKCKGRGGDIWRVLLSLVLLQDQDTDNTSIVLFCDFVSLSALK